MKPWKRFEHVFSRLALLVALLVPLLTIETFGQADTAKWTPSQMAEGSFCSNGGLSFRVEFANGWPILKRTSYLLPTPRSRLTPAYEGDADIVLSITFDVSAARKPNIERESWDHQQAPEQGAAEHRTCPLQHLNGDVLAKYWILGKRGKDFTRYVDTTRFKGDLYYIQNLAAAIDSCAEGPENIVK